MTKVCLREVSARAFVSCALVALAATASAQTMKLARFDVGLRADLDAWYQPEYQRLEGLCRQDADCWRREMKPQEWVQGPVFGKPDAASPPIGHLVALARVVRGAATIEVPLVFRANDGTTVDWISDHDWGYTTAVFVRNVEPGNWVQLALTAASATWIKVGDGPSEIPGELRDDLVGEMVRLRGGLTAIERSTGRTIRLLTASPNAYHPEEGEYYVIERVSPDGWMEFRVEVGADMACGDEVEEKKVVTSKTPRYRIRLERLFDSAGFPMIAISHPKGC